jgi:transposase
MAERTALRIDRIRRDGATQPRATIDFETVFDYMDAMVDGAEFPPVSVFYDGTDYWLADGFHRVKAAEQAGFDEITCELFQGTQLEAQWYSFAANKTNGLRRTNDDKQRAVKSALMHPNGAGLSDRQVGSHVGVDHKTVAGWRTKLEGTGEIPQLNKRTGSDGKKRKQPGQRTPPESETQQLEPAIPAPCAVPEEMSSAPATPQPAANAGDGIAWEWCERVYRASMEIGKCEVPAQDLALSLRRCQVAGQITEQLEKANEFITAVLAEARID